MLTLKIVDRLMSVCLLVLIVLACTPTPSYRMHLLRLVTATVVFAIDLALWREACHMRSDAHEDTPTPTTPEEG